MLKTLLFSDLQAAIGSERCFSNRAIPLQSYRVSLFFEKIAQIYKQHRCNALWDLGDTMDDRTAIPIPTISIVLKGLSGIPQSKYDLALIGNHDQYLRDTTVHNGDMFRHRFKIVDKITVDKIEGVTVICSAYPASEKELAEQLDSLILKHRQTPTVILGHWTVKGCQLNSGLSLSGLGKELLDRVDLALLGDVHKPQKIGKNGYYVGSPFQQDYGEAGEAKRVAILTLDNGAISLEFVPMVGFPEYRVVGYQQFVDMVTESSEDRYQVIIKSPEEAEKYYAHPLSGRAQPIYNYALTAAGSTEAQQATTDWSLKPSIVYWTKHHPPLESGVSATEDELAAFGESIAADGV